MLCGFQASNDNHKVFLRGGGAEIGLTEVNKEKRMKEGKRVKC